MAKLPNAETAIVEIDKLRHYCLSESHPVGKHKARAFRAALGLSDTDSDRLRNLILEGALQADAKETETDEYGVRYELDIWMVTEGKSALVRTAWIIRIGETSPRLTACYVSS